VYWTWLRPACALEDGRTTKSLGLPEADLAKSVAMQKSDTTQEPRPDRLEPGPPKAEHERVVPEIGGPPGPEPTRFGDWEKGGRCIDF
jgi:shikimate dehydrogenase